MKHKTLSHTLLFFVLSSVGIILFFNFFSFEEYVLNKITSTIEKSGNISIEIEEFSLNERRAIFRNIALKNKNQLIVNVPAVDVRFRWFDIIKNYKEAITTIRITEPSITYYNNSKNENKKDLSLKIPDFSSYFDELVVEKPAVQFYFSRGKFSVQDSVVFDYLSVKNTEKKSVLDFKASESLILDGKIELDGTKIENAFVKLSHYFPNEFTIIPYLSYDSDVSISVNYADSMLHYIGEIGNPSLNSKHFEIKADKFYFDGNQDSLHVKSENLAYNNQSAFLDVIAKKPLSKKMTYQGKISAKRFNPKGIFSRLNSRCEVDGNVFGTYTSVNYDALIRTDSLTIFSEKITDIELALKGNHKQIMFDILSAYYFDNEAVGQGFYDFADEVFLEANMHDSFFDFDKYSAFGDVKAYLRYKHRGDFVVEGKIKNAILKNDFYAVQNIDVDAKILNSNLALQFKNQTNTILGSFSRNFKTKDSELTTTFRRFDLAEGWLGSSNTAIDLPYLSGNLTFRDNEMERYYNNAFIFYGKYFGRLGGRISAKYELQKEIDFANFNIALKNGVYNYQPITFSLSGTGNSTALKTSKFLMNNEIESELSVALSDSLSFQVHSKANDIAISDYLKYFLNHYNANQYGGRLSFDAKYSSDETNNTQGTFHIHNFYNQILKSLDAKGSFIGNQSMILVPKISILSDEKQMLELQGQVALDKDMDYQFSVDVDGLDLAKITLEEERIKGIVDGQFYFDSEKKIKTGKAVCGIYDFQWKDFNLSNATIDLEQRKNKLAITKIFLQQKNKSQLYANGNLNYNIFSKSTIDDAASVSIRYKGKIFDTLNDFLPFAEYSSGIANATLNIKMEDERLSIFDGDFDLEDGEIKFIKQSEIAEDIDIHWKIKNNILSLDECSLKHGDGRLNIQNEITNTNQDILLGTLNLGKLLFNTSYAGLLLHVPGYMPNKSEANIMIEGLDSKYGSITGPIDQLKIAATVNCLSGEAIYPPNTKNIITLLSRSNTIKKEDDDAIFSLPFNLDIRVNFSDNIRYVTYPVDLKISDDSFFTLFYDKDQNNWYVPKAEFNVDDGTLEMFGETFKTDDFHLFMSQFQSEVQIFGIFNKKTADGTTISIEVFGDKESNVNKMGNLQFRILSDNADDKSQSLILARLYNQGYSDELSREKNSNTILQDEFITYASVGIENMLVDPIISPVQNKVKKIFKLDSFNIKPGVIQNIFSVYTGEEDDFKKEKKKIRLLERDILLNNLYLSAGKYLSEDVFLDYEVIFRNDDEFGLTNNLYGFQTLSVRYDLPQKWKIYYRFDLNPKNIENSHEIMLQRSFRFKLPDNVWRD